MIVATYSRLLAAPSLEFTRGLTSREISGRGFGPAWLTLLRKLGYFRQVVVAVTSRLRNTKSFSLKVAAWLSHNTRNLRVCDLQSSNLRDSTRKAANVYSFSFNR